MSRTISLIALLFPLASIVGCVGVRRELTVESEPSGALVYVNGDEIGRTPVTKEFLYYGTADIRLRKEGYETLEDHPRVWAPAWQIPPIDLVTEASPVPIVDRHRLMYELTPVQLDADPQELVARGIQLRGKLESSEVKKIREKQLEKQEKQQKQAGGGG